MGRTARVHSRGIRRSKKTKKRMRGGAKSVLRVRGPVPKVDPKDLTYPKQMNSDDEVEDERARRWRGHTEPTIERRKYRSTGLTIDEVKGGEEESVTERTGRKSVVTHGAPTYIPPYGSTDRTPFFLGYTQPGALHAADEEEFLRSLQIASEEAAKADPTNLNVPPDCPCPEDYPNCIGVGEGYFNDGGWCYKEEINSSGQSNKIFNNRGLGECGSRFGHNCTHSYGKTGPELQIAEGKALDRGAARVIATE
jgi:hypothetical protein